MNDLDILFRMAESFVFSSPFFIQKDLKHSRKLYQGEASGK
jgi:hypothetical protein